jgi:quercetin dioxygenase-like cupin family protein
MRIRTLAAFIILAGLAGPARTEEKGYPARTLLSTGLNVVGETLRYPTTGAARVTASIVTIAPGEETIVHRHGVPLFAYVLEGELTVNYGPNGTRTYRKGDAFMEAIAVPHFGSNTGSAPVRLLEVYVGAEGSADVIPGQ